MLNYIKRIVYCVYMLTPVLKQYLSSVIRKVDMLGFKIQFLKENTDPYITNPTTIFINTNFGYNSILLLKPRNSDSNDIDSSGVMCDSFIIKHDKPPLECQINRFLGIINDCCICYEITNEYNRCIKCNAIICPDCLTNIKKCPVCYNSEGMLGWFQTHDR